LCQQAIGWLPGCVEEVVIRLLCTALLCLLPVLGRAQDAVGETVYRGPMVLLGAEGIGVHVLGSLKQAGESGVWAQVPRAVRSEWAGEANAGTGFAFAQWAAITASDRSVQIESVHEAGDGAFVLRYRLGPAGEEAPANAHVVQLPKHVEVRAEVVTGPANGAAGLVEAIASPSQATGNQLDVCHRFDCAASESVTLSASAWAQVRALFPDPALDAAQERARVAEAIGLLERLVGPLAGTSDDKGGWSGNAVGAEPGQQDCLDEAANTTTYLALLLRDGLLRFHQPTHTRKRGFFATHFSASVREVGSGQVWIVDAWFRDNGQPAVIQTLEAWKAKKTFPPLGE
jgi:hypothetical protein